MSKYDLKIRRSTVELRNHTWFVQTILFLYNIDIMYNIFIYYLSIFIHFYILFMSYDRTHKQIIRQTNRDNYFLCIEIQSSKWIKD